MVPFELGAALATGLAATTAMTLLAALAKSAGMTEMPPMEMVVGSLLSGDEDRARTNGAFVHWLVLGTAVFGVAYAGVFSVADDASWWLGAGVGAVHGVLSGAVFLPLLAKLHPRMEREPTVVGGRPGETAVGQLTEEPFAGVDLHGDVKIEAPGVLGHRWGPMTPVGLVVGHVVYGVVAAVVYGMLV